MQSPTDLHESERLASLDHYDILDTPPEDAYDRITRLACAVFDVPMSTITMIDAHRQWFKSREGVLACETPRGPALCNFAIRETRPLIVPDTQADERFRDNPFVTGAPHIRFYAGAQLLTPAGHAIGTLCAMDTQPRSFDGRQIAMLSDLAGIVVNELELRMLVMHDSLTGARSRRALLDEANRTIALAIRHKHNFSCVVFDIDQFKSVNDSHGHAVGDRVLQACVKVCQQTIRQADSIGRVGGEEFAVLLPYTNRADAMLVAEKIRAAIAGVTVQTADGPLSVSASFGIATLDRTASDIGELLKRGDAAMYIAKQDGRNRCVAWQAPPTEVPATQLRRVFKAGQIAFNGGRSTIDCTVRGLSETNAKLDIFSAVDIPERFKLNIPVDETSRMCRVLHKDDKNLAVAFE